jgi:hypothetical protein
MSSTYTWTATSGAWTDPANWADLTMPGAGTAPGDADSATISGPNYPYGGADVIYGVAVAATLTTSGGIAFAGTTDFGAWTETGFALTDILAGATVSADTAMLTGIVQVVGPMATLTVPGTLTNGSDLGLFDGASLRAQNLAGGGEIEVDPTATAEIGGGSIATAGTLAIDTATSVDFNGEYYSPVLLQGTIVASIDAIFYGPVTGTGEILIDGAGASAQFDTTVAAGITIAFTPGEAETLYLPHVATATIDATIAGFQLGDTLAINLPGITAATYTATGDDLGTLALLDDGATVETLVLAGAYTNSFLVVGDGRGDGEGEVVLSANAAGTPAAAIVNPGSDAYSWNITSGGDWGTAVNWTDTTTSAAATTAPGATNSVTLTNTGTLVPILNGNGNAASLSETGIIALNGTFDIGALSVGVSSPYTAGTLDLLAGSALSAGTAAINDTMLVGAGANFTVGGTIGIGNNYFYGVLFASDGGRVVAGGLSFYYGTVATDASSAIEIGNAGSAVLGALNVDPGITVNDAYGTVATALVNNGVFAIPGTYYRPATTFDGAISGTGTLQLGPYADLVLKGSVATSQKINFAGTEATLDISAAGTIGATIAGLVVTDKLLVAPTVAGARFLPASANSGLLDLTDANGNVVETLAVSGALSGDSFLVLAEPFAHGLAITPGTPGGVVDVVLAAGTMQSGPPPAPSAGTQAGQSFTWDALGGAWGTASNWGDVTTAPGSLDTVALDNGSGFYSVISGAGNAASASEIGGDALSGSFDFGSLSIASPATGYGWLDVAAGATLHAGTVTVTSSGTLQATGAGATLAVSGALTLGDSGTTSGTTNLDATGGASARIATLLLGGSTSAVHAADIEVDAASTMEIGTSGGAAAGALTVDAGQTIGGGDGLLRIDGNVTNNGIIAADAYGVTIYGSVAGTGTLSVGNSTYLTVIGAVAAGQTIAFTGTNGSLVLTTGPLEEGAGPNNAPPTNPFAGTIAGFSIDDSIQVSGTVTAASYTATGADLGTLTLSDDGTAVDTLTLAGDYSDAVFLATAPTGNSVSGVSSILLAAACFAEGTRLDTPDGPIAIERLCVGDWVLTVSGSAAPVRWIGRRRTDCRRHPRPRDVWPVRVAAHAFGPGQPRRPVLLSPDHAVFVDGVLIPIRHLIDGDRIAQMPTDAVTYWHVELPRHDIVLSEGLPSESYLDTGNRAAFDNGGPGVQAHPDFSRRLWDGDACAPLVVAGPLLERVRAGLRRAHNLAA